MLLLDSHLINKQNTKVVIASIIVSYCQFQSQGILSCNVLQVTMAHLSSYKALFYNDCKLSQYSDCELLIQTE